jgi:hypothetical protein
MNGTFNVINGSVKRLIRLDRTIVIECLMSNTAALCRHIAGLAELAGQSPSGPAREVNRP